MAYSKKTKIAALLICVVFCVAMAFSAVFIIAEADHDCVGENCPICAEIAACVALLETAAVGLVISAVWRLHHIVVACICRGFFTTADSDTLVSLKVKLSN